MSSLVSASNINKYFGNFHVLKDISFEIQPGRIVGLIGPNGAGKTTTLKALLGLCGFEGQLNVLGHDPRQDRHRLMKKVCFIADVGVLPRWLKVNEAVEFLEGVHTAFDRQRALQLLATTEIPLNKKVGKLSKGMVTQLHLALVMSIDVDLLVLDEPTLGLDILYRKSFYDRLLNDFLDGQRSVLITTHQVEEVEPLLTDLLFIDQGEIVLDSSIDQLNDRFLEVLVTSEHYAEALQLEPVHQRPLLGKTSMLFESGDRNRLACLGDVRVPGVADLFVALLSRKEV